MSSTEETDLEALERLIHEAVMMCCICHDGPEDMTMHGGGHRNGRRSAL